MALAQNFSVTRKTFHARMRDFDVLKRANFLSMQNKMMGDIHLRREYLLIAEKATKLAQNGSIAAMKLCLDRAFPVDKQSKESGLSSLSLGELIERAEEERQSHFPNMIPSWMRDKMEQRKTAELKSDQEHHQLEDPKNIFE